MIEKKFFYQTGSASLILFLVLSLVAASVVVVKKNSNKKSQINSPAQSAVNSPTLSFSADPIAPSVNQDFNLLVYANPAGKDFHAFELYFTYNTQAVEALEVTSSYPLINSTIDPSTGTVTIIGTRTGSPFSGTENQEVARVRMTKKSDQALKLEWRQHTKLGNKIEFQTVNSDF